MLDIDMSVQLRTVDELHSLIDAVDRAEPEDECEAVEWKRAMDLTKSENIIAVSRWIIGTANRSPQSALMQFEGLAYLLIGAGPAPHGTMQVWDDSDLRPKINKYVSGPRWTSHTFRLQDRTVLLFVTEPPSDGDRIHCLQKELTFVAPNGDKRVFRAGEIMVRVGTSTRPASPQDLAMLQDRLLAGGRQAALDLRLRVLHLHIQHVDADQSEVDRWIDEQASLIAPPRRMRPGSPAFQSIEVGESNAAYEERIAEFLRESRRRIRDFALDSIALSKAAATRVRVRNDSDETASGVRIVLNCPTELEVRTPTFEPLMPPVPARQADNMFMAPGFHLSHLEHAPRHFVGEIGVTVVRSNGCIQITKKLGKMHPHETVAVDLPALFYFGADDDVSFRIDWALTANNRKGNAKGSANVTGGPRTSLRQQVRPIQQSEA